jgi:hypothetical protein
MKHYPPHYSSTYSPLAAKTFRAALSQLLAREFPHLGGPKVRELFVAELEEVIDRFYPPRERLRLGQVLWLAVDKRSQPHDKLSMRDTPLVPVVLTLVTPEDIYALAHGKTRTEVSQQVVLRLHQEAAAQGGVLAESDTAVLLCYTPGHIGDLIRDYEIRTGEVVPRRGTVHDLGGSVTHKGIIAYKALREHKNTLQVARETAHTYESVDRYLRDLARCYLCLKRLGQTVAQTTFTTGLSLRLVRDYDALITELGLTDETFQEWLDKIEEDQHKRQEPQAG